MLCLLSLKTSEGQVTSKLWGENGESWQPGGRLPDFSFAGYRFGEAPLPKVRAATDVCQHGAIGDGKTDCTQAFVKAIEATDVGAITIPPGRYVIRDIIYLKKPCIVLRGAGPEKTVILCPRTLEDVRPNMGATSSGEPTSNYSWSGGFFWVQGKFVSKSSTSITSECRRGSKTLKLEKTTDFQVGQRVLLQMRDDSNRTLINHLYSGEPGSTTEIVKPISIKMVSRIASVQGKKITLERPLRWDVRKEWNPTLKTFEPTVTEVGIEDLAIEFPIKPYRGHFTEFGMNGIAMNGVSDCWIRNVRVSNSDSGIFLSGLFCTLERVTLDSKRPAHRSVTGHHGITLGADCLVKDFDFKTHFIHDLTVSRLQAGNVVKNGKGTNLSLDHHKYANHENLFCNLDVGLGSDIWRCGGGKDLGKHCGARGTFWCIRSQQKIGWPPKGFGPDSMNFVGLETDVKTRQDPRGKWLEAMTPSQLHPADLHRSQLNRRLRQAHKAQLP